MTITDPFIEGRLVPNEPVPSGAPPDEAQPPVEVDAPPVHANGHGVRAERSPSARTGQVLPHDIDVEKNLLGAALLGAHQTLDQVPDGAFYAPAHGHIAHAIRTLAAAGTHLDTATLASHLRQTGLLDLVGGTPYLATIMVGTPSIHGAASYAQIVLDHHRSRRLIQAARELEHTVRTHGPDAARSLLEPLLTNTAAPEVAHKRLHPGSWILDAPATPQAIWGKDSEVLWAVGEPCLITGPPGVGKTTLTGQLVRARLGLDPDPELLGWPVQPDTTGKVLYLASDRPQQIRRALARCFTAGDRADLDERLVVWAGPPPQDLARNTGLLTQLAQQAGATTVVLDSLKDMAIGLSDDEVGAGLNQAMQLALSDGIDVLALHHQRKGTDGKRPKTLEDLYGSTWIAAGAGSILLLWGGAGDLIVELHHLKQPSSDVGPLKIEHDHEHGQSAVHRGFDLHAALRHAPKGLSASEVARMWLEKDKPTDNERRKAQRRLDNAVKIGQATRRPGVGRTPSGQANPDQYFAVDHHSQEQF